MLVWIIFIYTVNGCIINFNYYFEHFDSFRQVSKGSLVSELHRGRWEYDGEIKNIDESKHPYHKIYRPWSTFQDDFIDKNDLKHENEVVNLKTSHTQIENKDVKYTRNSLNIAFNTAMPKTYREKSLHGNYGINQNTINSQNTESHQNLFSPLDLTISKYWIHYRETIYSKQTISKCFYGSTFYCNCSCYNFGNL